jgi:hypothetical protein
MESVLKSFSVSFLLRSVFAGAFFVISYQVAVCGPASLGYWLKSTNLFAVAVPIALVAGVSIYGLHRALLYPLIECLLDSGWCKHWRSRCPLIRDETVEVLVKSWDMAAEDSKRMQERAQQASAWADFTHLQYVSCLCIAGGAIVGNWVVGFSGREFSCPLIVLAFIFFIAGLISDWRLKRVRDYMLGKFIVSPAPK